MTNLVPSFAEQLLNKSKPLYQDLFHRLAVHAKDNEDIAFGVVDLAEFLGYERDEMIHYIDEIAAPQPQSIYEAEVVHVADILKKYGGGFMSSLGEALIRADFSNRRRILSTFENEISELWNYYRKEI